MVSSLYEVEDRGEEVVTVDLTVELSEGEHTLTAVTVDFAWKSTTSDPITVTMEDSQIQDSESSDDPSGCQSGCQSLPGERLLASLAAWFVAIAGALLLRRQRDNHQS